jgi:hypothetical protein
MAQSEVDIRSLAQGSAHGQPRIIPYVAVHNARFPAPRARGGNGVLLLLMYVNDGPAPRRDDFPRVRCEDDSTVRKLKTRPLAPDGIAQAFPLIQMAFPEVTLEEWRDFASPMIRAKGRPASGIITVISEQDYIVGLCCYRVEHELQHGPTLMADHFLAFDLFDRQSVFHALAAALESLARERLCTAVHTNLLATGPKSREGWLVRLLCSRGHRIESLRMCKLLARRI